MAKALKVRQNHNEFFPAKDSSKKQMNEFNFTAMIPHFDLFSIVFWKKLMAPRRHFEIIRPLEAIGFI